MRLAVLLVVLAIRAQAQIALQYMHDVQVWENEKQLTMPFAGGINAGQYSAIDLNGDRVPDLVVFDRAADKILPFLAVGETYEYAPEFVHYFPKDIRNWMLLADYDCDGKKDLFTYATLGVRVFRNVGTDVPAWEMVADPVYTQGSSSQINLNVNSSDVPVVADLDGDGDLDILTFNFAFGGFVEFHQNMSVEKTGNCSTLNYERVTREYGDFEECTCDTFVFEGNPCPENGRLLHAGGKAMLAIDMNNDGATELVIGQEECTDLTLLQNGGTRSEAKFTSYSHFFPEKDQAVNFPVFPAAYYEDVNFDGLKDIVLAPNVRTDAANRVDFSRSSWWYENTGSQQLPVFEFRQKDFLQSDMLDVGLFSYPAWADVTGDGLQDLIVGNRKMNDHSARLQLYTQTLQGLVLSDDDFAGLSAFGFTQASPSFYDLNADGRADLVLQLTDSDNQTALYYVLNKNHTFNSGEKVLMYDGVAGFDDTHLYDISGDGVLDLLLGKNNGKLQYYRNTGSNLSPAFELEQDDYLGVGFSSAKGSLHLVVDDLDADGRADLLTTDRSGIIQVYSDFMSETSVAQSEILWVDNTPVQTALGRISHPSVGVLAGQSVVAVGNIAGGIQLFKAGKAGGGSELVLQLAVFPNPSYANKQVKFRTPNGGAVLEIFSLMGSRLYGPHPIQANETLTLDLPFAKGMYLARITESGQSKTVKFLLGNAALTP